MKTTNRGIVCLLAVIVLATLSQSFVVGRFGFTSSYAPPIMVLALRVVSAVIWMVMLATFTLLTSRGGQAKRTPRIRFGMAPTMLIENLPALRWQRLNGVGPRVSAAVILRWSFGCLREPSATSILAGTCDAHNFGLSWGSKASAFRSRVRNEQPALPF